MTKVDHQQVRRESPRFKYQLTWTLSQLRKCATMRVVKSRTVMLWVTQRFANLRMAMHHSRVLMCSRLPANASSVITKMEEDQASSSFYQVR